MRIAGLRRIRHHPQHRVVNDMWVTGKLPLETRRPLLGRAGGGRPIRGLAATHPGESLNFLETTSVPRQLAHPRVAFYVQVNVACRRRMLAEFRVG